MFTVSLIANIFDRSAHPYPRKQEFPARQFEQQIGISGISRNYTIPESVWDTAPLTFLQKSYGVIYMRCEDFESRVSIFNKASVLFDAYRARIINQKNGFIKMCDTHFALWEEIKQYNPSLINVNPEPYNLIKINDVVMGAISGFNENDIQYYISAPFNEFWGRPPFAWTDGKELFRAGWRPCQNTVNIIEEELQKKTLATGQRFKRVPLNSEGEPAISLSL